MRKQFVAEVGLESWEDVVATVPQYIQLKKFRGKKGKELSCVQEYTMTSYTTVSCYLVIQSPKGTSHYKDAT